MPRKKEVEIVLDVETTGLDYTKEKIIEFAGVRLENGKIVDSFETLVNPHQKIRKSSMAVHGITDEMLENAPSEEEIFPKIFEFIGDNPIVAHNAIFDYSFLNKTSKRLFNKPFENRYIDTQFMFKEVYPHLESCGLDCLMDIFKVKYSTRHRAMADAEGLAKAYPKLKKMYFEKYNWQLSQIENVEYLFERFLRLQSTLSILKTEIQYLTSIFRNNFEKGGAPITANSGETMAYNTKKSFAYDFEQVKDALNEIGVLEKAVRLNNVFIDKLVLSSTVNDEIKDRIKSARCEISENRVFNVIKPDKDKK